MSQSFKYVFPSIKGRQAGREYYVSMCPLGIIPKIFLFDEVELSPELRAQRYLNKNRIPEIARYILNNEDNYVFSALTASIDSEVTFEPVEMESDIGSLHIPMTAKFIINDGQHRRAAIEIALNEKPELEKETIAVVFFLDPGLQRCQQMFSDLNQYAIRSAKSLNVLYDKRDKLSQITRNVVFNLPIFKALVDLENTNLSRRSRKLFTLSSINTANRALLKTLINDDSIDHQKIALHFWEEIIRNFPDWERVYRNELAASEVRTDFLHTHGIILQSLGHIGSELIADNKHFNNSFSGLQNVDWSRSNNSIWEGVALVNGRVSKSSTHVQASTIFLKTVLGLNVSEKERELLRKLSNHKN